MSDLLSSPIALKDPFPQSENPQRKMGKDLIFHTFSELLPKTNSTSKYSVIWCRIDQLPVNSGRERVGQVRPRKVGHSRP